MPPKKGQKRTRRNEKKYPAFDPLMNVRSRQDKLDFDYIEKLSEKEKKWLNNFVEEEIHANFDHPGKKLNVTSEDRKRIYTNNNAWNRDVITRAKLKGKLTNVPAEEERESNFEDGFLDLLDRKLALEKANNTKKRSSKRNKKSDGTDNT